MRRAGHPRGGERRRLLLVGYGQRGRQWHAACRERRDVTVAGAVDPDPAAQEQARQAGLDAWATLQEALGSSGCDAAVVASPPGDHPNDVVACLRSGLAVLVEKPFTLSLEDAARVAQESAALGIPVAVGQNFRFLPRERAVLEALAGDVGKPLGGSIVSARPAAAAMPHLASIEHGPLWDICIHHLDAMRVRFGAPPERVAMSVTRLGGSAAGPRVRYDLALEWRGGPAMAYQHSEGAPGYYHSEWLECERRAIVVHDQDVSVLFPRHRPRSVRVSRTPAPEQAVLDDLLGALRTGTTPVLAAEDNLLTVATVEAAVMAEGLRRPVTLDEVGAAAGVRFDSQVTVHA